MRRSSSLLLTASQYTTHSVIRVRGGRVSVDHDPPDVTPCQTIFCLKDKNQRKVNSHSWFINGVCGVLNPTVAVFLEAGTIPQPDSLYALCAPLYQNSTVAATTGFCRVFAYSKAAEQLNAIVGFQKFEYQLNNALDRPLESLLGRRFSMNKGGYSAYRFSATAPSETESGAFGHYFDGEKITRENGIIQKNSALTEDRVIASSLLRLDRKVWRVVSVDTAQVAIDVPGTMEEFCLQRRRWICGEFFSTLREMAVVASTPPPVWNVTSIFRLIGLLIGTVYQALNLILQFLAVVWDPTCPG
jgi:chitin synthase